jgi:GNAT superfamily N-acetyltransferase
MLSYFPLSSENIDDAIRLVREVFPDDFDTDDSPEVAYRVSVDGEAHKEFITRHRLDILKYFIVKNEEQKTIGVTGWYTVLDEPKDIIWLGWYCVSKEERRKGFGKEILEWTIDRARDMGYKRMRLYTTTHPGEATAQILYEKLEFKLYATETTPGVDYTTLFREKEL